MKLYGDVEFNIDAAYLIPNVMDMANFNIYLGSYWSHLSRDENQGVALIIVMVRG
nr:carbohydrate porin [Gilliamella apicola]